MPAARLLTDVQGFDHGDPNEHHNPSLGAETCEGPFIGSQYCHYGEEFDCFVSGVGLQGGDLPGGGGAQTVKTCREACAAAKGCEWWVLRGRGTGAPECKLKSTRGAPWECADCAYGPRACPGMG